MAVSVIQLQRLWIQNFLACCFGIKLQGIAMYYRGRLRWSSYEILNIDSREYSNKDLKQCGIPADIFWKDAMIQLNAWPHLVQLVQDFGTWGTHSTALLDMPFKRLHRNMERISCLKPGGLIKVSSPKCCRRILLRLHLLASRKNRLWWMLFSFQKKEIVRSSWEGESQYSPAAMHLADNFLSKIGHSCARNGEGSPPFPA